MDKLKAMEQMSRRISNKCDTIMDCEDCTVRKYNCDDDIKWCGDYESIDDYKNLVHKCKLLNIDISDLVQEETTEQTPSFSFTVDDIKPGYLLKIGNKKSEETTMCIGMQNKDDVIFCRLNVSNKMLEKLFSKKDILNDFTIDDSSYILKVYGYINDKTICYDMFDTKNRHLLWERNDGTYDIYNGEQRLYIAPNEKEYKDGGVYIEDKTDEDCCILISQENLPHVIAALQEVYDKYYKNI